MYKVLCLNNIHQSKAGGLSLITKIFSIKKSKSYFVAFPWVNRQMSVNPKIIEINIYIITEKITFVNKVVIEL